jgi:Ca2+-transporting ATPase
VSEPADTKNLLPAYQLTGDDVLRQLKSNQTTGLSSDEAAKRQNEYGPNKLDDAKRETWVVKYVRQFKDFMIILLTGSSIIALLLEDGRTAVVLILLVLLNTTIGFFQEFKAERIMESLQRLVVPDAQVLRDGRLETRPSTQLVYGDVVYIEEGNSVPADIRILSEQELSTNDFALTGESQPTRKFTHAIAGQTELGSRHNLAYMGTTVATGTGYGVVIGTGMQTELGRIAGLSQAASSGPSPLQREMGNIAKRVTQMTLALCLVLLLLAIQADLEGKEAFLFAVGIASSLVPNGLPAAISTVLAQAAGTLAKKRALVKKLSAVETLGATSIICTDKTGTLTKNQMTVEKLFVGKDAYLVTGTGYDPADGVVTTADGKQLDADKIKDLELFFATGAFASNARVDPPDDEHASWYVLGDPTEGALITLANKAGLNSEALDKQHPELKEFAFDSVRKRMSSVRTYGPDKQRYLFIKGAPEGVLDKCTDIWDHGHVRKLTAADRKRILNTNETQAQAAMRNLVFAYRILPPKQNLDNLHLEEAEQQLTYMGMVSMIDPLRDDVAEAMDDAHAAHIKVSIVTGDYATTALAIATRARLGEKGQELQVVTGEQLRTLEDAHVLQLVEHGGVIFSRVSPEDKLRIVELVKSHGYVVAVTGDGINDAPALKTADIGVAMGVTGTDVAKQSAEIVLLDDSFHTLVGAIQQGRVIFANIKKIALMCFVANASELWVNLFSLGGATLLNIPLALVVMQILAVDLIAELIPVAALGWDQADRNLMKEAPRNPRDHILNKRSLVGIFARGLLIGSLSYLNYLLLFYRAGETPTTSTAYSAIHMQAMALTYLTIVLCQWANILQSRSSKGIFTRYQLHNPRLWIAFGAAFICVLNIIYNPLIASYFRTAPLTATDWLYALAAPAIFLLVTEFHRWSNQHHTRQHVIDLHKQSTQKHPA